MTTPDAAIDRRWDGWFRPERFLLLLGLVVFAGYWDAIVGTNTFVTRDFAYFGYPLAYYHRLSFWSGEIPLWNPLSNCGLPFLAQWNTMALYPGSLFYLLMPLSWSLGVFCLLHLMLGGVGMYFLAWKWTRHRVAACVAGMVFATNGLTLNSLMWPNNISALGWMPWVILLTERAWSRGGRALVHAIIVGGMQMLTGAPEVILLTWVFIGILGVSELVTTRSNRRVIAGRGVAMILFISGLAAAQLLPFLDLLAHSQRDERFFESVWPMPGTGWANFLVPLFRSFATSQDVYFQPNQYWTTSYYLGCGAIALALLGVVKCRERRALLLLAATLLSLILALGDGGYLYPLLKRTLPGIGFMRFPIKFVVLAIVSIPLLAAYGTAALLSRVGDSKAKDPRLMIRIAATLSVLIGLLVWFAYLNPEKQEKWSITALSGLSRAVFLWAVFILLFLLRNSQPERSRIVVASGVILLMGFDPMTYTHQKTPTAPRGAYDPNLVQLNPRPRFGESRVVMTYWAYQRFNRVSIANPLYDFQVKRLGLFANCNLLEGIPKLDGFYSLYLHEPDAIWSIFYFQTNNTWISRSMPPSGERHYVGLLDFLGASFESKAEQHFDWTPRTNYLPLVTAGQVPVFADQTNTLQGLVRPDFDPRRHVFMPPAAKSELPGLEPSNPRISTSPSAQHVSVSIWAERPALIVISQSYYTPWQAYVDDRPARIWKANFAFQAVSIPSGHHVVRFIYRDWKFIAGAILSAIALLYCAGREVGLRCRSPIESSPDT